MQPLMRRRVNAGPGHSGAPEPPTLIFMGEAGNGSIYLGGLPTDQAWLDTHNLEPKKASFLQGVEKAAKSVLVGGLACRRLWFGG